MHAQALEHYPPLPVSGQAPQAILRIVAAPDGDDDRTTGPALLAIVLVGDPASGLDRGGITARSQAFADARLKQSWLPFVGRPISPRLINQIEASLTRQYAARNLAVTVRAEPEQDLSTGVIRIRLVPIVVGKVTIPGETPAQAQFTQSRLGVHEGQAVDSQRFAYDLAALNRYPFRQTEAIFARGAAGEASDLNLIIKHSRPWEAYAGFKYSGSEDLTMRRYFVGGTVGNLLGRDSVLSFQAVVSPDLALHGARHPKFKDITANYSLPATRHMQVEASLELSELNFHFAPSIYRFVDVMATTGVRLDIADFSRTGVASDVRFGVEAKNEQETVFTGTVQDLQISSEVMQVYAGYHRTFAEGPVHSEFDILTHVSPGGLDPGNTSVQARLYSEGRVTSARYAYVNFSYDHAMPLNRKLTWHILVTGQLATAAIPFSEQGGVGSAGLVRGYFFIDGTFDDTLVVRNELSLNRKEERVTRPYVFFDAGAGKDLALGQTDVIASIGLGAMFPLPGKSTIRLEGVHTLRQGQFTKPATNALMANLTFKY